MVQKILEEILEMEADIRLQRKKEKKKYTIDIGQFIRKIWE